MRRRDVRLLKAIWQVPLGLLSYGFHLAVRWPLRVLSRLHFRRKGDSREWELFSANLVSRPLALAAILTTAPRWNTHAVIATAGPFTVQESIRVDIGTASDSSPSWSVSVHRFPGKRLVASLGTLHTPTGSSEGDLRLDRGRYILALRYYGLSERSELPAVLVDGAEEVKSKPIPPDVNAFYETLAEKTSFFYLALSYYVFVMLSFRRWLPRSLVEREYTPVGGADTVFHYGAVCRGESLTITLDPALRAAHDVYCTLYDCASFPVWWAEITEARFRTKAAQADGYYLVRVRPKSAAAALRRDGVEVRTGAPPPDARLRPVASGEHRSG